MFLVNKTNGYFKTNLHDGRRIELKAFGTKGDRIGVEPKSADDFKHYSMLRALGLVLEGETKEPEKVELVVDEIPPKKVVEPLFVSEIPTAEPKKEEIVIPAEPKKEEIVIPAEPKKEEIVIPAEPKKVKVPKEKVVVPTAEP